MLRNKIPDYTQLLVSPPSSYAKNTNLSFAPLPPTDKINCTLIPGDGAGPELVKSVTSIFKASKVPITFEKHIFSELHPEQSESLSNIIKSIEKNRICLQGIIAVPFKSPDGNPHNWNTRLKEALDLYASVVYIKSLKGVPSKHPNVNFVIIKDQTEGSFKETLEHETVKGVVESLKIITRKKSERIAKFAFDYAITQNRKKIVAVHKANIFRITDGLFLESCRKVASHYPKVSFGDLSIGSCVFELTRNPQYFDIILTPSLYGSVIENMGVGIVGGAGVVPATSFSPKCAMFECGAKNIYDETENINLANPTAMILSAIKLLRHIKYRDHASIIEEALLSILKESIYKTKDIGGDSSVQDFTNAIINALDLGKLESLNPPDQPKCNIVYKLSTCA